MARRQQCLASGTSWWSGWMCGISCDASHLGSPQTATRCMVRLSACIFEWDAGDVERLKEACGCKPSAKELARHCRRRTRGTQETKELIEQLLKDLMEATDTMGVRLFDKDRMKEIWRTQQHHIDCIQDPPGSAAVQKDRAGDQRGGHSAPVLLCMWLNVLGVLPPAPKPLCARYAFP